MERRSNGILNGAFNSGDCFVRLVVLVPIVGPPVPPTTTCTKLDGDPRDRPRLTQFPKAPPEMSSERSG